MDWQDNLIKCNAWCSGEEEIPGEEAKGVWLPCMIDLSMVFMIKTNGKIGKEKEVYDMGAIYDSAGNGFTIDIPYDDLVIMFETVKKRTAYVKKE